MSTTTKTEISLEQLDKIAAAIRRRSYPAAKPDVQWEQLSRADRHWWRREAQGVLLAGQVVAS